MTPKAPKWALVLWPDAHDPGLPSCIHLEGVPDALARGAVLVAQEDLELTARGDIFNAPRLRLPEGRD